MQFAALFSKDNAAFLINNLMNPQCLTAHILSTNMQATTESYLSNQQRKQPVVRLFAESWFQDLAR